MLADLAAELEANVEVHRRRRNRKPVRIQQNFTIHVLVRIWKVY